MISKPDIKWDLLLLSCWILGWREPKNNRRLFTFPVENSSETIYVAFDKFVNKTTAINP